jgi:hypothetical protein
MSITQDNALTAGANENIADVKDNIDGVARDVTAVYRTIHEDTVIVYGDRAAGTYLYASGTIISGSTDTDQNHLSLFYFDDADYSITGLTTKMRVRAQILTNATRPLITFTTGLYSLTTAGAADTLVVTADSLIAGSTVALASPAASTASQGNSGTFTIPSDGVHGLALVTSGQLTDNASVQLAAQVQIAWTE